MPPRTAALIAPPGGDRQRWILAMLSCLILTLLTWGTGPSWADPDRSPTLSPDTIQPSLVLAGRSVDEAWEIFHQAALGGTLASPDVQRKIEQALHAARRLFVDAQEAAQVNDRHTVVALVARIGNLVSQIKEDSRRPKP